MQQKWLKNVLWFQNIYSQLKYTEDIELLTYVEKMEDNQKKKITVKTIFVPLQQCINVRVTTILQ